MNKKQLESVIDAALTPHSFKKRGGTWYRRGVDLLQVFDLQKSSFGGQFYVNLCFVPDGMSVEGMPTPRENKCPIRIRATSVFADFREDIEFLFDLERNKFDELNRISRINKLLNEIIMPFYFSIESRSLIKESIERGDFHGGSINLHAKENLGIDS